MHFIVLVIHLFCAIGVVGYVFFDACVYPFAKRSIDEKTLEEVKKAYTRGSAPIFGGLFLLLLLSGVYLFHIYMGGEKGYTQSTFQILLLCKVAVVIAMILVTFVSIFFIRVLKRKDPFGKYSHIIALLMCLVIVFLAKAMFWL